MKLVYMETQKPVRVGDVVTVNGEIFEVEYFREPHSPASSGKISLTKRMRSGDFNREYYVSVVGAEWIEREDRLDRLDSI